MGHLRLQASEIAIVEAHPDNDRTDLYIHPEQLKLFPELDKFCSDYELNPKEEDKMHDVPAPAIIVQSVRAHAKANDGKIPDDFQASKKFKEELIKGKTHLDNWLEAKENAHRGYNEVRVAQDVAEVLKDTKGEKLSKDSIDFWVMVRGLRDFIEKKGKGKYFPVSTAIPDFHTDTKSYVALKRIYKKRALEDVEAVKGYINTRLKEIGRKEGEISDRVIARFVKNCRSLHLERTSSLTQELTKPDKEALTEAFEEFDFSSLEAPENAPVKPKLLFWYFAFRAADAFLIKIDK
eukprot:UN29483